MLTLVTAASLSIPAIGAYGAENLVDADVMAEIREMFEPLSPLSARESIETVLARDDFHRFKTYRIPKFVFEFDFWKVEAPVRWEAFEELMEWLARLFAGSVEVVLITLAFGLVVWILYRYRDFLPGLRSVRFDTSQRPGRQTTLLGMEVTAESLPADVVATVLELWRAGATRDAYSTLYRATLMELMNRYAVEFGSGFTERECVRAARARVREDCADYFNELTRHWELLAYAHRMPSEETVQSLCETWAEFFGPSAFAKEQSDGY